ncbi:MAG: hypothetical protein RMM53_12355 [Bacteroidia bacterium]|nr:hypothetical protein [Bacteroidia bacterium]MDW8334998.1 hypothetical protein [Bacteroidia bacterium]
MKSVAVVLALCVLPRTAAAQMGVGLRFGSAFNYFLNLKRYPMLITGVYSNIVVGPTFKMYFKNGSMEAGASWIYKQRPGLFNLPLVQQNFNRADSTSIGGMELDFKGGPRFLKFLCPRIGIIAGYRWTQRGLLRPGYDYPVNRFYAMAVAGLSADLPTGFGTTGAAFYYQAGLANVIRSPQYPVGGRMHAFYFELHVMLDLIPGKATPDWE